MLVAILRVLCALAVQPNLPPRRKEREEKLKEAPADFLFQATSDAISDTVCCSRRVRRCNIGPAV
jgi:hypothetical protein